MIALFLTPSLLFDRVSGNELVRIKKIYRRNDMSAQEETTPTKKNYKKRGLKYLLIAVVLLAIWLILTLAHIPSGFIVVVNTILLLSGGICLVVGLINVIIGIIRD